MQIVFPHLLKYIELFKNEKPELLQHWMASQDVNDTLSHHGVTTDFFSKYFGSKVIDYAFGVIEGKNKLGNCPVIGVMLMFFEKKNIPLEDVFTICVNFKNTFIDYAYEKRILDHNLLAEICTLIDHNFFGVIQEYLNLHYNSALEYPSCSLSITVPEISAAEELFSAPSKPINAVQYVQDIDIDYDILQELADLEQETLASLDLTAGISQSINLDIIDLFTQYAKMIDRLMDFEELSFALWVLIDLLKSIDLENYEADSTYLVIYTKAIINDLAAWRISVFIDQNAEDIHYLDKTLLSSITQLQIMLSPHHSDDASNEIEFFL